MQNHLSIPDRARYYSILEERDLITEVNHHYEPTRKFYSLARDLEIRAITTSDLRQIIFMGWTGEGVTLEKKDMPGITQCLSEIVS